MDGRGDRDAEGYFTDQSVDLRGKTGRFSRKHAILPGKQQQTRMFFFAERTFLSGRWIMGASKNAGLEGHRTILISTVGVGLRVEVNLWLTEVLPLRRTAA